MLQMPLAALSERLYPIRCKTAVARVGEVKVKFAQSMVRIASITGVILSQVGLSLSSERPATEQNPDRLVKRLAAQCQSKTLSVRREAARTLLRIALDTSSLRGASYPGNVLPHLAGLGTAELKALIHYADARWSTDGFELNPQELFSVTWIITKSKHLRAYQFEPFLHRKSIYTRQVAMYALAFDFGSNEQVLLRRLAKGKYGAANAAMARAALEEFERKL
jgi:hypothetical protein